MRARTYLVAGAVTLVLAAGSVTALAATRSSPAATSGCTVPAPTGQEVRVVLADMGGMMPGRGRMMLGLVPRTVSAGTVTIVADNQGTRTHELLVLPLAQGQPAGGRAVGANGTVDEAGSLGEASRSCGAGAGDGIDPGRTGWVTLTLRPGRYELLCNQPGHYAAGMHAELDVT